MNKSVRFEGIADFEFGNVFEVRCSTCEEKIQLNFNGGELDSRECSCGNKFELVHGRIDLEVTYKKGGRNGFN